ncbi:uncharacterized protein M6B38_376455 [Iris pallida]|uniref:Uncharacterized protein n=1 Tax=Iris pallida TaxID=29817 RepID=A0AAX6GA00_IRIPA|nr:uncharacterized protein M6B38_182015 [Iris pallida]KAJ6825500.1 uncharacterized protein M6B38_376455 [Iris pallida]
MSAKVHVGAEDDIAAVKLQPPELPKAADGDDDEGEGEEFAKCDCCGLTEECTPAYVARIRGRYDGRWICGLCSEAVEEVILRSDGPITTAEALDRHMSFSRSFRPNPKEHLISAMRQLLRRSLDSPRAMRSTPSSPRGGGGGGDEAGGGGEGVRRPLGRSGSCFSSIGG